MIGYIYPQLSLKPSQDFGFFRLGGPGLANCLFVAARAYLRAKDTGYKMLRPTWERFSIGQVIRGERDRRFYYGLFKNDTFWDKLRKVWLIRFSRNIIVEAGLKNFFEDLIDRQDEVREWFLSSIDDDAIQLVPENLTKCIAVHVRLGDFPEKYRTSMKWYASIIKSIHGAVGYEADTLIFSDGKDDELTDILRISGTRRVFYGNALADIVAISRCGMLIAGKYSTFSAWGAYLGDVPSIFQEIDYGRVLHDNRADVRLGDITDIPQSFIRIVRERFDRGCK